MTALETKVKAIASVRVGSGTIYAVQRIEQEVDRVGPDGASDARVRTLTWRLKCFAEAASLDAVATLKDAIETQLCVRGAAVTLTRFGGSQTMPAQGGSGGSQQGYPRVSVSDVAEESFGTFRTFTVTAMTRIPVGGLDEGGGADADLVEHEHTTVTSTDEVDDETLRVSGRVRLKPGSSVATARAWIQDTIIDDAESDADGDGRPFAYSFTEGLDALECAYEYSVEPAPEITGGSGVDDARVVTRTTRDRAGRITLTVSGSAKGSNATTFAAAQKPTQSATQKLVRDEITEPQTPDGRVDFRYERLSGVVDESVGTGRVFFRYEESVELVDAGAPQISVGFPNADPVRYLGASLGFTYQQSTTIEYTGDQLTKALIDARLLFAKDRMDSAEVRARHSTTAEGLRRVSFTQRFFYDTEQTMPEPYQVPGLT